MESGAFLKNASIHDTFWTKLRETARQESLPYQWKALNDQIPDAEPSYGMRNFHAAAGKIKAEHGGYVFQDSDVAKWLEAVAYSLMWHPDAELERVADSAIDDSVDAQQPDGYLDTYYILTGLEKRWTNLMDHHELYCAGHMIEGALAYEQATGKQKLLDAMLRLVDHIDSRFGREEGKLHGYPGHPVLEMALMRLYERTGDPKHLKLAEYFITERGRQPLFFEEEIKTNHLNCYWDKGILGMKYYQAHEPLSEQQDAVGHAVRALYLYAGMADVARVTQNAALLEASRRLWNSVTEKQMYITGNVGSSSYGEAFTFDYDLPNDTIYGESCASVALVFLAQRMLRLEARGSYADVMERALYNGIISGMELDGKKFFYVNPLEVVPEACAKDEHKEHVKPERQKWFGCACCPPNIVRLLMSLQQYIYSQQADTLFVHLYVEGDAAFQLENNTVQLQAKTNYPWDGDVSLTLRAQKRQTYTLALRIPGWSKNYTLRVNGQPCDCALRNGYVYVTREWRDGDTIDLHLPMEVRLYRANTNVRENAGKLAVMRGPIVYCLEEKDNGDKLHLIRLGTTDTSAFHASYEPDTLGGVVTLSSPAWREEEQDTALYMAAGDAACRPVQLRWIPYYTWANRGIGEMLVWVRE